MKINAKKYPLLICMIISCVVVVASLFILGFFGMNLGTTLGGGSQFEITMPADANSVEYVEKVKTAVSKNDYKVDSTFVEDKYIAGESNTEYTQRCLVVKIAHKDISDVSEEAIRNAVAEELGIDVSAVSTIENITSVVKAKNVLFLGLAVGIIAICLFVLGLVRYDIFAGLSFILSYLHNIILYLSILILTRVQLNLMSLGVMLVLTLAMSAVLIQIYEKNREITKMRTAEKMTVSERMISSELSVVKPFLFIAIALFVFACLLMFVPTTVVRLTSLNIVIALFVTAYTSLLIGPGVYASLLEIKDYAVKASLSRNDTVNKAIKKKIKKNTSAKEQSSKN